MVNIGQNIKDELDRQERSISWLAQKLNCNRASVYRILSKNSIDTGVLLLISGILNHDFFHELSAEARRRMLSRNGTDLSHF